jgi:hypothetical protein
MVPGSECGRVIGEDVRQEVSRIPGRSIAAIRRISYVVEGSIKEPNGPIEITLADSSVLFLDAAGDGEALAVNSCPWTDPFTEPLSDENRDYVQKFGKWNAFDVSHQSPYSFLIGEMVNEAVLIRTQYGKVMGVSIRTATRTLRVDVESDTVIVSISS